MNTFLKNSISRAGESGLWDNLLIIAIDIDLLLTRSLREELEKGQVEKTQQAIQEKLVLFKELVDRLRTIVPELVNQLPTSEKGLRRFALDIVYNHIKDNY